MKEDIKLQSWATVVVALTVIFMAGSSRGAMTFDYSYTFANGKIVSGSLQGDQVGDNITGYIKNIANVTVLFDGTPMSGPIYAARYDLPPPYNIGAYVNDPVVYFDVFQNNFSFVDGNIVKGEQYYEIFDIGNWPHLNYHVVTASGHTFYSDDHSASSARWSLTAVPEPSTFLAGALLLVPMLGLLRRRSGGDRKEATGRK